MEYSYVIFLCVRGLLFYIPCHHRPLQVPINVVITLIKEWEYYYIFILPRGIFGLRARNIFHFMRYMLTWKPQVSFVIFHWEKGLVTKKGWNWMKVKFHSWSFKTGFSEGNIFNKESNPTRWPSIVQCHTPKKIKRKEIRRWTSFNHPSFIYECHPWFYKRDLLIIENFVFVAYESLDAVVLRGTEWRLCIDRHILKIETITIVNYAKVSDLTTLIIFN